MPLHNKLERRRRRQRPDPLRAELADATTLIEILTTRASPVRSLLQRLEWRGTRLRAAIESLRQRGLHLITADQLTVRLATPADSDRALDLLEKIAPRKLE